MPDCLIGLGSNVGDCSQNLDAAVQALENHPEISRCQVSRPFETAAVGGPGGQPGFLNVAVRLSTLLSPPQLLSVLQSIELAAGRVRTLRWGPRVVDLDLLLYGDAVIRQPENCSLDAAELVVPHRRMSFRRFVLEPAAEVAPEMRHPTTGLTIAELLIHLNHAPHYVALAAPPGGAMNRLAAEIATRTGASLISANLKNARPAGAGPWGSEEGDFEQQMAVLERATDRLRSEKLPESPRISDFWFDALLLHARTTLKPPQLAEFERSWTENHREVARPRLIVIITTAMPDRFADAAIKQAAGQGPLLILDTADFEQQITEIEAAVLACQ